MARPPGTTQSRVSWGGSSCVISPGSAEALYWPHQPQGMPVAKANYKFDKRQRDLAKQKKKEEKLAKKQAKKAAAAADESGGQPPSDQTP